MTVFYPVCDIRRCIIKGLLCITTICSLTADPDQLVLKASLWARVKIVVVMLWRLITFYAPKGTLGGI